jgi:antitoxin (DNA-binding transcriptional repressor) of toxin-antitoxin stability system
MISIDIRELAADVNRYIRQLATESRIFVTDHGEVVAELCAPDVPQGRQPASRSAQLVAAGVVRPATDGGDPLADWPSPKELLLPAGTVAALIDEDRGRR